MKALALVWLSKLACAELDAVSYEHPRGADYDARLAAANDAVESCFLAIVDCDPLEIEAAHDAWLAVPEGAL